MTDLRNDTVTVYEYDYAGRFSGVNEYSTEDYYYNTTSKVTYDKQSKVTKRVLNISYNILDVADKSFNATETTSYVYDEENRLSSWTVSISKSLTQSLTYDDFDRVSKITNVSDGGFYNEVSYGYNDSSSWKIDSYTSKVGTSSSNTTITYEYEYDYKGNIISIETSDGKDVSYEYDEIGQLIRENNQKLGKTYVYTYDDAGNILTKKVYSYTTATDLTGRASIETKTYGYGNESWGDQLTSYGGTAITYDAIGNPLSYYNGSSYTFTWEGRRLKTATKGNQNFTFTYNVDGIRTSKTVNGVEHIYTLNGSQIVSEEWDGYLMVYIYDTNGAPIGMHFTNIRTENNGWLAYWFEKNLQGDIVAVYGNNGIKYAEYDYDAWGNCTTTYFNNGGVTAAMFNPFRYRGYYYDADLGLYYLNSRYYDSNIGRFVNADGQIADVGGDIIGYNLFAYCFNNPVNMIDSTGNWPSWSNLIKGSTWLAVGITAVCVGVSVLTCGVAAPAMVAVAAVTVGAGALTAVNGAAEVGEGFTGYNVVRDTVFNGNQKAYDAYANTTAAVAEVGTLVCGGWLKSSSTQTKIADKTLQNVIDNPNSVTKLSTDKFHKIANKSSWEFKPTQNNKGYRALKGDMSIRYNMNGTRFDAAHFGGSPYWVISSAKNGTIKIMMP